MRTVEMGLCFLQREESTLLARMQRGPFVGYLNGHGGKREAGENITECIRREVYHEAKVSVKHLTRAGIVVVHFPEEHVQRHVIVYRSTQWEGVPSDTDEMRQHTFYPNHLLPYEQMLPLDHYWMPLFLERKRFFASGTYVKKNGVYRLLKQKIEV